MGSEYCGLGAGDYGGLILPARREWVLYCTVTNLFLHVVDDGSARKEKKTRSLTSGTAPRRRAS